MNHPTLFSMTAVSLLALILIIAFISNELRRFSYEEREVAIVAILLLLSCVVTMVSLYAYLPS